MYPDSRSSRLSIWLLLLVFVLSTAGSAQTRSKTAAKKASAKKSTATAHKKTPKKMTAAQRRKEAARKKAAEAKRQAALAEKRRREKAAREARARKLAFERGLKTETAANIAKDITAGEDLRIRQVAVNALGSRAGTVVVMDAKSGRIVTMVNQDWAIKEGFKPCSTIKLVTGVAGISEKLIDPDGNITGDTMKLELNDALAYSNNAYFQRVGVKMGNEKMIEYARRLGLGQKTGINAPGEFAGKLPYGNKNPRIYSHADDFEVTPLQLAVMVTAISNGGQRITPQIRRSRVERTAISQSREEVAVPNADLRGVLPGMIGAAEYGTARRGVDASWGVAGKTGSCIGRGSWVGLFTSVAPVEDPEYAVVVITRGQNERGKYAAAIAGEIYRALAPGFRRDQTRYLALKERRKPSPIVRDRNDVELADLMEGDEDSDIDVTQTDEAIPEAPRKVIIAGSSQRPTDTAQPARPKKIVTRTVQSKPVFPPVVIEYKKDTETTPSTPESEKMRPRIVVNPEEK
jgi:hypothetical protein